MNDEFPMVKKAVELFNQANKPILGICAGIQEINVVFGGSLNPPIENHNLIKESKHKVKIEKDNILAIQWHPEVVFDRKIFERFIDRCKIIKKVGIL